MKTQNWISLGLLIALFISCFFLYNNWKDKGEQEKSLISIIEEKDKKNNKLELELYRKDIELRAVELEQAMYERKVDSLSKELKKPLNCPERVGIQSDKIKNLKGALKKCNEAKAIYAVSLGLTQEMNINNEVVIEEAANLDLALHKAYKKEKRKAFLKGFSTGGFVVGLLIILAL